MNRRFHISIVDDDESVRESLESLLKSIGFHVSLFESAEEFLEGDAATTSDCLILDVRLGGMSGPELQGVLAGKHDAALPIIFITAHGTEALRGKVIASGAVDCLLKPFSEEKLLSAVEAALGFEPEARSPA